VAEPAQRRTDEDGGKFYEHPTRLDSAGAPAQYDSVTSALSIYEKDGLKWWAAKLAARRAADNLPKLLVAQRIEDCGRAWARTEPYRCGQCVACVQRWVELFHVGESSRRRREGSVLHDVLEYRVLRDGWPDQDALEKIVSAQNGQEDGAGEVHYITLDVIEPYVAALRQWWDDFGLTTQVVQAAEMTVWNHSYRYAGTLDLVATIHPVNKQAAKLCARLCPHDPYRPATVLVDLKTREGEGKQLYDEHSLQLTAYRHAETCTPKFGTGEERPMLTTHGAMVLQVRPDGYTFEPVLSELSELHAFLGLLTTYRWKQRRGPASIAVGSFPVPAGWVWDPGAKPAPWTDGADAAAPAEPPPPAKKTTRARKAPAKKAAEQPPASPPAPEPGAHPGGAPRMASATLDSLATSTRGAGVRRELRDEDIPF
jgi:hypothetical protein